MNVMREARGTCLCDFPSDFVVLDLETTGLDPTTCEIIEIGMMRVKNNHVVSSYDELIHPSNAIEPFITSLTGITNDMVADKPSIADVLPDALDFMGDSIIVGHNVKFDVNFVYDNVVRQHLAPFTNDFVDTLKLSRKLVKGLCHYRLCDMVEHFNIEKRTAHRALSDVAMTFDLYECLRCTYEKCRDKIKL